MKRQIDRIGRRHRTAATQAVVETLETRNLFSAFHVTSDADDGGAGTLRQAITAANANPGPDTIDFDLGIGGHTINLAGQLPSLLTDMDIHGPGADLLTIRRDTGGDYAVLFVTGGHINTVSGVTVSDGDNSGIANFGSTLTLSNCIVSGNSGGAGGGIINGGSSSLTVNNCTISGNVASLFGGGIDNTGSLAVKNCTISGNDSLKGGGIDNVGSLLVQNSTLSDNTATFGGGIESLGGNVNISNSIFSGNAALQEGGAIQNGSTMTVTSSTFSKNHALSGGGISNYSALTASGCTFSSNHAAGGGLFNLTTGTAIVSNSTFIRNIGDPGGAINNAGTLTLTGSTLSDNLAKTAGGILNAGTATITACTLSGNAAVEGGAILNGAGGAATIVNSTFQANEATFHGGAIYNSSLLSVFQCTLSGNMAGIGAGIFNVLTASIGYSTISGNTASETGGGLVNESLSFQLFGSIVALNTAPNAADVFGPFLGGFDFIGTDHPGVDPMLAPLADNGGPTKTIALLPGSPCIDAGDPIFPNSSFDQRGSPFKRIIGGRIDIGAFEFATPAQVGAEINDLVHQLPLNGGNQNALSAMLNITGNNGDTARVLAFINQLDTFVKTGKLTAQDADPLLTLARSLLDSLN